MINNTSLISSDILVSIIVPAYNVESYINKCLSSILSQTHKKIEVIVINDGSTDNTGQIIDDFSMLDPRIKVLHESNKGVSAARNTGIEISTGEYLVFVDGDDYIANEFVDYMLNLVYKTGSEFCLSTKCFTKSGEKQTEILKVHTLQSEDATALLLSPEVIVGCWNKIFKRSLVVDNKILFSTSLFYGEGLTFITTLSQISTSVGVGNRKVYYYRRNNEASATTKFDINKLYNGEKALMNIKESVKINNEKVDSMMTLHLALFYLGCVVRLKKYDLDKVYLVDYIRWKRNIKKNLYKIFFSKYVSIYRKLMLTGGSLSPWLLMKLDDIRRRNITNNSVE